MTNLKSKLPMISIFVMAVAMTACSSDNSNDTPSAPENTNITVSVQPLTLNLTSDPQTAEITINANTDWSIRTDADWVSLRPAGGVKNENISVKVTVTANQEFDERVAILDIVSGGKTVKNISLTQGYVMSASPSISSFTVGGQGTVSTITVTSNTDWKIETAADWLSVSPAQGGKGETKVEITAQPNRTESDRSGNVYLLYGDSSVDIKINQLSDVVNTPEGYTLVWSDEFNEGTKPASDWVIENQAAGWVNHELQTYTSREVDGKSTLEVKDGFLHINCFKASDGKIYSGRMNAKPGTGWTYGYFEARINLPSGKGTWPAFWMMPSNVDWNTNGWPKCGEIDIMEEVGVDANRVSSSLHTEKYNHTKNTQKTHEMYLAGAEGEFHTYALEWTEDEIVTYVDGKVQLRALKSDMGSDHESWPFHYAFYPILNLAWGGDWGGYAGVNENALPVTMLVDYVRIFQKN